VHGIKIQRQGNDRRNAAQLGEHRSLSLMEVDIGNPQPSSVQSEEAAKNITSPYRLVGLRDDSKPRQMFRREAA
jgi:uncharacterized caspase-like protein